MYIVVVRAWLLGNKRIQSLGFTQREAMWMSDGKLHYPTYICMARVVSFGHKQWTQTVARIVGCDRR